MSAVLCVRVNPPCVELGPLVLRGQWAELYALLAIEQRAHPPGVTTLDRVHRLATWRPKQPHSVGKEIARHLQLLKQHGLGDVLCAKEKTKAWRLGLARASVQLVPSESAVSSWLRTRLLMEGEQTNWGEEMQRLVEAALLLRRGAGSTAQQKLGSPHAGTHDPTLRAWRALLMGRAAYMAEDQAQNAELERLILQWSGSTDPAGRAVGARLLSYRVLRKRFTEPEETRKKLTKLASDCELAGDVGSLGVILNVLGLLERALGNPEAAFEHFTRAAGLVGISGDYHMLQAVAYNAARARGDLLEQRGERPDELAFRLLDLCLLICQELHVGQDSALAEITRAAWLLEKGDHAGARDWLDKARSILRSTEASYDQAYFREIEARLRLETGGAIDECIRDLRTAARLFGQAGDAQRRRRVQDLVIRLESRRRR